MASTGFVEDMTAHLNANAFNRAFSFSSAQLPALGVERPGLADLVVLLDGIGCIFQLSERQARGKARAGDLEKWFASDVLEEGVDQIRSTRELLRSFATISLVNSRGHRVSIAANRLHDLAGLILYRTGDDSGFVPPRFRKTRFAGFVHIMRDTEYFGIRDCLVTPAELNDYLRFREAIFGGRYPVPPSVSEAALVGQYLLEDFDAPPDARYEPAARSFQGDPNAWAFSYVIENLSTQIARRDEESVEAVYHRILAEVARLGRRELQELRTQLRMSLEAVRADRFELPYRLTSAPTQCGFLVLPGSAEFRLRARETLENLAVASKHELQLEKQVSIAMWRSGEIIDIDWLYTEGPNSSNAELDKSLERDYPFRRSSEKRLTDGPVP